MSTLADDEAAFAALSRSLLDQLLAAAPGWIERSLASFGVVDPAVVNSTVEAWQADVGAELAELFSDDVDAQRVNPLAVLRRGVAHPTAALERAGVAPVDRERFAVDAFPADHYDLSPAAFADIDPDLAEPGLVWGAAKAHVHLRRRRERT